MQLELVLMLEYSLWLLCRLCRLLSISLPSAVLQGDWGAPHFGFCQVNKPESGSCVYKGDFVLSQERRTGTETGLGGKTSNTELGAAGGCGPVAAAPDGLGRQLWLLPCMYCVPQVCLLLQALVAQTPTVSLLLYPPLIVHSGQEAPVSEGLQRLGRHAVPAGSVVAAMLSLRRAEPTGGVGRRCAASAAAGWQGQRGKQLYSSQSNQAAAVS